MYVLLPHSAQFPKQLPTLLYLEEQQKRVVFKAICEEREDCMTFYNAIVRITENFSKF